MDKGYDDIIVKTISRLMIPFIQLYALYVILHGHYSPGGGFQGGVILGASLILFALAFGRETALEVFKEKVLLVLCGIGVIIYAGAGYLCLLSGGNYLDYGKAPFFHPPYIRSFMIMVVEIGVGITVMAVMASISFALSRRE